MGHCHFSDIDVAEKEGVGRRAQRYSAAINYLFPASPSESMIYLMKAIVSHVTSIFRLLPRSSLLIAMCRSEYISTCQQHCID